METSELFKVGEQALKAQSFSRLLGTVLIEFKPGVAVLEIPVSEDVLQQNGFVHGGVLSYAADNTLTFVAGSVLGPNVLTAEYKINYLRPAVGEKIIARGTVVSSGKRQAVCRCDISIRKGEKETVCAIAQGTIMATESEKSKK